MRNLLLLQPLRIYERWPMPADFTGLVSSTPTLAFPQLAGALKDFDITYLDGIAQDLSLDGFAEHIQRADAILINAHSSIGALNVEANVEFIRSVNAHKVIIIGGHHATLYDLEWLGRGVDFVVRQEGERTIVELMQAIAAGGPFEDILGLSWRGGPGGFHRNPPRPLLEDLDDLPMPDWTILDPTAYHLPLALKGHAATVETSRGCAYNCDFCAATRMWNSRQRFKSAERVLEELRILQDLGYKQLWIADDNFLAHGKRDKELFDGILKEGLEFHFMAFLRADAVVRSPDLVKQAVAAGLRSALVGFETPVERILNEFNKGVTEDVYLKAVEILRANGIFIGGFFMVGYLDETPEETARVFRAAEELCDYPIISIFEPRRGTPDFDRSAQMDELPSGDMFYHNTTRFIKSKRPILKEYRRFYSRYLKHPKQLRKLTIGTPTERAYFRVLYRNMARSILEATPDKILHPWEMVRSKH